jgi:hypothetical protein
MRFLKLPKFDVPDLPDKKIPLDVVHRLISENVRGLKKSGQYRRIRNSPACRPVDVRFVLR